MRWKTEEYSFLSENQSMVQLINNTSGDPIIIITVNTFLQFYLQFYLSNTNYYNLY